MVYIPVDHEHARHVQTLPCVLRSYRDVVEQAEAHRTAGFGMVAGRPHLPERRVEVAAASRSAEQGGAGQPQQRRCEQRRARQHRQQPGRLQQKGGPSSVSRDTGTASCTNDKAIEAHHLSTTVFSASSRRVRACAPARARLLERFAQEAAYIVRQHLPCAGAPRCS